MPRSVGQMVVALTRSDALYGSPCGDGPARYHAATTVRGRGLHRNGITV